MSHKDKLYAWLQAHRPDVFAQIDVDRCSDLAAMSILNRESGLEGTENEVKANDKVEDGSRRFLSAFQSAAMKAQQSANFVA